MEVNKSTDELDRSSNEVINVKKSWKRRRWFLLMCVLCCVVGIGSLMAATTILINKEYTLKNRTCPEERRKKILQPECSEVREDSEVQSLFKTIKARFHELYPEENNKTLTEDEELQAPFNFKPDTYRRRTETAKYLLENLERLEDSLTKGNLEVPSEEESHALKLLKYFLLNTFGKPYENNYEAGDWVMGPNIFCWQKSCHVLATLTKTLSKFVPRNTRDVEKLIKLMSGYGELFRQRISNLKYGVAVGLVPPKEACRAGLISFKGSYIDVAKQGERGIFQHAAAKRILKSNFLENVTQDEKAMWREKYKTSMEKSLNASILNNLGKPLNDLIRYLEHDYSSHCPPSNVSSGFASLPLPYVYTNGVADLSRPTNGSLPGGEIYSGSRSYLILLSFFTTSNITPKEIDEIANKRLRELYLQVVQIAKNVTKEKSKTNAIKRFREKLASDEFYHTIKNESNHSEPYLSCNSQESAKMHCPSRWKAMKTLLQSARAKVQRLETKLPQAFYLTKNKSMVPKCPTDFDFIFRPTIVYYSYGEGDEDCKHLAKVHVPFFLNKLGPKYEEMTVMAHETYPGHHLEVQGVRENFHFKCQEMGNWTMKRSYLAAFSEGWASYVEKHVVDVDMKMYQDDIMSKYGMLKHQILAALRAKVDVGLHFMGMKRHEAVSLYEKYAWEDTDVIEKQVTRLQSAPGQGSSYLVGEATFSELRKRAEDALGKTFDIRDFHYEVLAKGPLPMDYLRARVENYIKEKVKNSKR